MTMGKKALATNTTYSKWEKDGIKRVYLNSPILRWHGVKIYYDGSDHGFIVPHQDGKLTRELLNIVNKNFSKYLIEKGIVNIADINSDDWYLHLEKFDDFWNAL